MIHTNTIDDGVDVYAFIDIRGGLNPRKEQLEQFVRKGRNDIEYRKTGIRGRPVRIQTLGYYANRTDARTFFDAYTKLIGGPPVTIIQHSHNYGLWDVLDVSPTSEPVAQTNAVGVPPGNEIRWVLTWTVIDTIIAGP